MVFLYLHFKPRNMKNEFGIVLYNIENDDCLNGVWINPDSKNVIRNEIAKRIRKGKDGIDGSYLCSYIEWRNVIVNGTLEITLRSGYYEFYWTDNSDPKNNFEGNGYRMNDKQIAVYYKPI